MGKSGICDLQKIANDLLGKAVCLFSDFDFWSTKEALGARTDQKTMICWEKKEKDDFVSYCDCFHIVIVFTSEKAVGGRCKQEQVERQWFIEKRSRRKLSLVIRGSASAQTLIQQIQIQIQIQRYWEKKQMETDFVSYWTNTAMIFWEFTWIVE